MATAAQYYADRARRYAKQIAAAEVRYRKAEAELRAAQKAARGGRGDLTETMRAKVRVDKALLAYAKAHERLSFLRGF